MQGKRELDIKNNIEIKIELKNTGINNPTSPWTIQNKKLEKITAKIFPENSLNLLRISPLKNISSITGTQTQIAKIFKKIKFPSPKIYFEMFGKYNIWKFKKLTIWA